MVRAVLALGVLSCAGACAYRGDWAAAVIAAAVVLLPAAWWVRGELLATRDLMCGQPVAGRHRRRGRPCELRQVPNRVLQPRVGAFSRQWEPSFQWPP